MLPLPNETPTLSGAALPALQARGIAIPGYERSGVPGVVHLGLGAFHRAHQAVVFDALLQQGDARWGVLGVGMHSPQVADALAAQDGLYSLQISDQAGSHWQVIGSVLHTCVASRERVQVLGALAASTTRWLTLTVTEKAYGPDLAALIVEGLHLRFATGLPGLTIASCDNLSHNGTQLKRLCLQAAHQVSVALGRWTESQCRFPNSMVDRIVPASNPARVAAAQAALGVSDSTALGTEGFWEWVIEGPQLEAGDALALESAGVTVVDDVAPYEQAKLQMLNASHSAMACIGAVAGLKVISDCISHPAIRQFIHSFMTQEAGPQMRRTDWPQYRDALLARFANPALQHSVHQIATDSSLKIPLRWVPTLEQCLENGRPFEHLAFACAAWLRYLQGRDDAGNAYTISDPLAAPLQNLARQHVGSAPIFIQSTADLNAIWGDALPAHPAWHSRTAHWLGQIQQRGMLPALIQIHLQTGSAPP